MKILFKIALSSLLFFWSLFSFAQTNKVEFISGKIEGVAPKVDQDGKIFREVKVLCTQNNRERLEYFVFEDSILIIRDDSGMEYKIFPDGTVVVSSYLDISNDVLNANASTAIVFQQNTTEKFGFDPKEHMEWADQYELIKLLDNSNYFVPNKSLGENEGDKVDFKFNDSLWTASDIYFKLDNDSLSLLVTATGNLATVTLPANLAKGKYKFYAMADGLKLGKLNLEVFEEKTKEVVIVPLVANYNFTAANIEAILESTFGEANVEVDVTLAGQWNDAVFTTSHAMQVPEEVGLLNKYSQEMRDLRDAYFDDTNALYKEKAYYLFVVPSFSDPNLDGYMVRGKGLGFVANNADLLVYAHELGHGIGALEHSWNENGPAQGSTNNLMDYAANAKELTLDQWKELRSFDLLPSLMDEVEDNMLSYDEQIKFYHDTKTWQTVDATESKMGVILLNGDIYKFKASDNISEIMFDKYGRVFSFIKGTDTLEAFIGRGNISAEYYYLGYLKLSDYREKNIKYKSTTLITPPEWNFIQSRKYKFDGCALNQNVIRYSVPFVHNNETTSALFQIWEKDCYVKEIFQKEKANIIDANSLNSIASTGIYIGPSFQSNNFTPVHNGLIDCELPAELSILNMNGCAASVFFELEDKVTNKTDLALLANYLSTLGNTFKYIFYDEPSNKYQYFGKDANSTQNNTSLLVEAFDRDNTFSISAFKAKYPRSKWFFARGFDSVISAVNIRQDIPAGYNVYSIDYASFETPHVKNWEPNSVGPLLEIIDYIDDLYQAQKQQNPSATTGIQYTNLATFIQNVRNNPNAQMVNKLKLRFNIIACLDLLGVYARYEYDMADLVQREKSSFKYQIVQNENAGKAIPLTLLNDYNQYVNKYDTECAFFLGMEYLAMYAETLFEPIVIANAIGKIQKLTKTYKNFKTSRGSLDDMLKKNSGVLTEVDEVFDLSQFKNLTARQPTGKNLTNLKKSEFLNFGYRIKPKTGNLKVKIDDIVQSGDNLGIKTESIVDDIMAQKGYTKLDGKYGSNNGFDGIYIKGDINNPTEIIIVESKQFKYTNGVADDIIEHSGVTLNPPSGTTTLPAQMSDDWINYVRTKLAQSGKTDISNMIRDFDSKITKYVTAVDKTQGEINFLKLGNY